MDFSRIKDNKVLKIALIIALPTALIAAYYGYKYVKKKKIFSKDDKPNENAGEIVDTNGMEKYDIKFPFNVDLPSKIYDKIVKINYSYLDSEVVTDSKGAMFTVIHIMAKPKDFNLINNSIKSVTPDAELLKVNEGK